MECRVFNTKRMPHAKDAKDAKLGKPAGRRPTPLPKRRHLARPPLTQLSLKKLTTEIVDLQALAIRWVLGRRASDFRNPKGIQAFSPGLARNAGLPWVLCRRSRQPCRGWSARPCGPRHRSPRASPSKVSSKNQPRQDRGKGSCQNFMQAVVRLGAGSTSLMFEQEQTEETEGATKLEWKPAGCRRSQGTKSRFLTRSECLTRRGVLRGRAPQGLRPSKAR